MKLLVNHLVAKFVPDEEIEKDSELPQSIINLFLKTVRNTDHSTDNDEKTEKDGTAYVSASPFLPTVTDYYYYKK